MSWLFIIGGDFNAKHTHWGLAYLLQKAENFLKPQKKLTVSSCLPGNPPTNTQKSLTDFFVIRKVSANDLKIEEGYDLISDHLPVYLTLNSRITEKECNPVLCNKHTHIGMFHKSFSFKNANEIEMACSNFTLTILFFILQCSTNRFHLRFQIVCFKLCVLLKFFFNFAEM